MDKKLKELYDACKKVMNLIEQNEQGLASWHIALSRNFEVLKANLEVLENETPPRQNAEYVPPIDNPPRGSKKDE